MLKNRPTQSRFPGVFRREARTAQLGIIDAGKMNAFRKFRDDKLDKYDAYYEKRQYDDLQDWDEACGQQEYVAIRKRKPRIIWNGAKVVVDRVAAKLVGLDVFPNLYIENDAETTDFFSVVQKLSGMKYKLMEPVKKALLAGSSLVRYHIVDGTTKIETYQSKYCYPSFQPNGELESVQIKYVYVDQSDKDSMGNPKKKWFRMDLGMMSDILYDNPEYQEGQAEPEFKVVEQTDHGLGWVQAEWLRTGDNAFSPDGPSIIMDILDFLDELNYSLSQSSQAVGYNQDPQLVLNNMDEDEIDALIRSATKAWNLGREGKAELLEGGMEGVKAAGELRNDVRSRMIDVVRVVMLDPEKIVGSAQSGKAMEVLHGPLVELINELRPIFEHSIKNLLIKIAMSLLEFNAKGFETSLVTPPNYMPASLDISCKWPELFPMTIEDLQKKVQTAASARTANLISPRTAVRYIAKDFGIEDIEEELLEIDAALKEMAALNPFGGGF